MTTTTSPHDHDEDKNNKTTPQNNNFDTATQVGAKHVTAIEANSHLAEIARNNIRKNGMADRIVVLNALSSDVTAADLPHGKADVLVRVCFVCLGFCVAHFDSTR